MFWGITLENGKRYTQVVERAFHVSMASLEQSSKHKGSTVSVMFEHEKSEFLLCTLQHGQLFQQPLDLNFVPEDTITLYLNGEGIVHLTGYVMEDEDEQYSDDEGDLTDDLMMQYGDQLEGEEDSDDYDQEQDSDDSDTSPQLANKKRKAIEGPASKGAVKKVKADDSDSDDSSEDDVESEDSSDEETPVLKALNQQMSKKQSGPQLIKTPQSVQKGKQQHAASPSKSNPLFEVRNGKGGQQQQKTPAKSESQASPKTPASVNGTMSESPKKKSAKQRKREKKALLNASQLEGSNTPAKKPTAASPGVLATSEKKKKDKKGGPVTPGAIATPKKGGPVTPGAIATPKKEQKSEKKINKLAGGTQTSDVVVGSGPEAKSGKYVQVYYVGKVGNKEFDSCSKGKPFKFRLGAGEVIKGWDAGVQGMKVGGKRTIVVPPNQGYGSTATGPIPANSTLNFDVQLISVS